MIRRGELWRLVTSIFPHAGILHLAFNIYWLWVFGTLVEEIFGHLKTAALIVLFAVGSGAWEFALASGGVGLSGVGYGLFGLIWMLSRHDERFKDAIDARTVQLFVGWFFFCIVATVTNTMPVANIAHGTGAVLGILAGLAITLRYRITVRRLRQVWARLFSLDFGAPPWEDRGSTCREKPVTRKRNGAMTL
jgi:membrane associated rhomboid family serine protease